MISSDAHSLVAAESRVAELGLGANLEQIRREGYTVVRDIASPEFTARLRETCLRLSAESSGASAGMLLARDPIFVEVVTNAKLLALAEKMCGKGFLLSQLVCSVRRRGAPALGLHADQNWFPAPFPKQNQLFTCCWTMDELTAENGATSVIPGSHVHKRHPTAEEGKKLDGLVPIVCPPNSLACWDGSVWHG
ncbi:hypothetical protein DFJ74DRAFT_694205 [Hyaloraphidium curvatum]|nr:hypothetical protein DFJ74DRAFT_694205 [Hyaloraphidium curvatum]